jgi:hypothetical protein
MLSEDILRSTALAFKEYLELGIWSKKPGYIGFPETWD